MSGDTPVKQLVALAQLRLSQRDQSQPLSRGEIADVVDQFLSAIPEWRTIAVRDEAVAHLSTVFSTFVGEESVLCGDEAHVLWLDGRRADIEWRLWERYRQYLVQRRLPPASINSMGRITDRALELIGDPRTSAPFDRRGMIVGDVQSGKTGNYTGLVCKAADAGYKVVIVLTGMNNNLRSQTQIRLDEGFLGKISVPHGDSTNRFVGVGEIDPSVVVDWGTNRTERGDFNYRVMSQFGNHPGGRPILLVVKKHGSVLNGVLEWIKSTANASDQHGPRFSGMPLLVIDDEADQASVDNRDQEFTDGVADPDHKPSAINSKIRQILGRFDQSSYVGYTATPFANIFIHPDAETGREFQDLFPRDFIINIPTPSTYVGASRLFGYESEDDEQIDEGLPVLIRKITDHASSSAPRETRGWMPPMHRSDHFPRGDGENTIPPSLQEALESFVLVVAARRARGHLGEHNSMLIHVTRFKLVQRQVVGQIQAALDALSDRIRYGTSADVASLCALWKSQFQPATRELGMADCTPVDWATVERELKVSVATIKVREINGSSADVLDYEANKNVGMNVIAIGGDKLSRGLTLEGLSVSYFLRGSTMYDTLLQMGRWFGYRPGYLDLCRLFTTSDLVDWYEHIARATEELRQEFDRMEAIRATPKQFGLRVRSHPILTITSRTKMRNGTKQKVTFAGDISETTVFATDNDVLLANLHATEALVDGLMGSEAVHLADPQVMRNEGQSHQWEGSHLWRGATADIVLRFLDAFHTHEDASRANAAILARYIRRQVSLGELTTWNVLLLGGSGSEEIEFGHTRVKAVVRQPKGGYGDVPPWLTVQPGDRFVIRRLLNPRDEAIDIEADGYNQALRETIENPHKRKKPDTPAADRPSGVYLRAMRKPSTGLLLVYPLARYGFPPETTTEHQFLLCSHPPIGIGISFPKSEKAKSVEYVVNSVYGDDDDGGET